MAARDAAGSRHFPVSNVQRAKIIDAQGELQTRAERLAQAGEIVSKRSEAMQLGCLGTLLNIAGE
jgi:hypothetical protein